MNLRVVLSALLCAIHPVTLQAVGEPLHGKLNITAEWTINVPDSANKVLIRAAKDLQAFLREHHNLELNVTEETKGRGIVLAVDEQKKEDCFSLLVVSSSEQLIVAGSSPRSVYQGVLLLEDLLRGRPGVSAALERTVVFPFQDRYDIWDCLLTGQNKGAIGFNLESHLREAVRLGYSGIECNRFVGMDIIHGGHAGDPYPWYTYWGPSMDQFFDTPLFEGVYPKDYLERNLADLKHVVNVVESFGLKPLFVGYEPRFVPGEFFQRRPDLRGPRVDHPIRSNTPRYSLCTDRPEVLQHYRTLARRLAEEVPGIREMHIIFHDSGSGFCWYDKLYSGRNGPAHCKDIPMGTRMSRFFMAIRQGFCDAGQDIKIVAQPHGISHGDVDAFFDNVPAVIDFTSGNWASWSLSFKDPLGADRYVIDRQRETGRRTLYYQQHFFGFDGAPTSEFPLPYYLAERLNTARDLELDALNTLGGFVSPPVKAQSVMQETYRRFLLEPDTQVETLVANVANSLGGEKGASVLVGIWKSIHEVIIEKNRRNIGFAKSTEYTCRRTLIRPLVPDASSLLPEEQDWWLDYTFGGRQRFGHAHLFRGEQGTPPESWYLANYENALCASEVFRKAAAELRDLLQHDPGLSHNYPYLVSHERQLRFLGHVYATGANLYEGQRILDKYNQKNIDEHLKQEVDADLQKFKTIVESEIDNTNKFLEFLGEGGDLGMVILPEETTWAFSTNLPNLLRKKIEVMRDHLPEGEEVLHRWFNAEY